MSEVIERYEFYRGTIKTRRGDGWVVRPEAEPTEGLRVTLQACWIIEAGIYAGEWAMCDQTGQWAIRPLSWIASGDLADIEHVGWDDGRVSRDVS